MVISEHLLPFAENRLASLTTYRARFSNNRMPIQLGFYLLEIDVVQSIDVR